MTQLHCLPKPPQTAADLLEGLLRSRLFAESLFGQVMVQSAPYLDRRAEEYAAALVEKQVITQWQASELLAGRIGLYAGTYRLLEKLATTESADVFVAEQAGAQRLVLLQVNRVERSPSWAPDGQEGPNLLDSGDGSVVFRSAKGRSFAERKTTLDETSLHRAARHPHIVRCLEVQQTPRLQMLAYEFMEAQTLAELLALRPVERKHTADLVRQFAAALVILSPEAIAAIGLETAWIDSKGQLKLLAGPDPWASIPELSQSTAGRVALQVAAVMRFAAACGGFPEIADCRSLNEILKRLNGIAQPWTRPFASISLLCPRSRMNRLLRRGPALRLIESFEEEQQVVWEVAGEAAQATVPSGPPLPSGEGLGGRGDEPEDSSNRSQPAAQLAVPSVNRRGRAWAFSALLWLLGMGLVAFQWFEQSGVRRARAAEEPAEPPSSQRSVTPGPSRTGHHPVPR